MERRTRVRDPAHDGNHSADTPVCIVGPSPSVEVRPAMSIDKILALAKGAILKVGGGRGFIVKGARGRRYVITAAHCLPHLPPAHPFSFAEERTYHNFLGPLGIQQPTVSAECVFVDPISDIAVLGEPDNQAYLDGQWDAYLSLVDERPTVRIGVPDASCAVWLHGLEGQWEMCEVRTNPCSPASGLTLVGAKSGNVPGTSGSPILRADGRALGVINVGCLTGRPGETVRHVENQASGQALLASMLPLWLLTDLRVDVRKAHALCHLDPLVQHAQKILGERPEVVRDDATGGA